MTPGARVAAAIEILDAWLAGEPAEKALTNWARSHRFAGSGDRAAIRDHVFDAIRCRRSFAAAGGAETGRGLMIGGLREAGLPLDAVFSGEGHAPPPLDVAEWSGSAPRATLPEAARLDCPDWLAPILEEGLGADFEPILEIMRRRAPVFLRANRLKASREPALRALAEDGIEAAAHPLSPTAIEVLSNARRVRASGAFREGLVEIQDASSQAVVDALSPVGPGTRVLDYCAGGGGKALALAATGAEVVAHDADPRRMADLPARAERAGATIAIAATDGLPARAPFDLVFADAPCSGSGAWRRQPEAKWRLTPERLADLTALQLGILEAASALVAREGTLAYATCSLLPQENGATVARFLDRNAGWRVAGEKRFTPLDGGDGFYVALLKRD